MALAAGSIAFVGINIDVTDNLAFVTFEAISAGTTITFTDRAWNGSAFGSAEDNWTFFQDRGESTWTWTATSDIPAGTVVALDNLRGGLTPSSSQGEITFVSSMPNRDIWANDAIYAFTGDPSAPTFLTALALGDFGPAQVGRLDNTGLELGVNAMQEPGAYTPDIATYVGPTSGFLSMDEYRAAIFDPANWATQRDNGDQSHDGTNPDLPFSTAAFTANPAAQRIGFANGAASVSEGDNGQTLLTFTLVRDGATSGAATFAGTIASLGVDAADFGGTLPLTFSGSFADGATTATVTITVSGDTAFEADESFILRLTEASNAAGTAYVHAAANNATGTILNDDTVQIVEFAEGSVQVAEGDAGETTLLTFTVTRSGTGGTVGELAFSGVVALGTADDADFGGTAPTSFSGVIHAGESSATVTIAVSGDFTIEDYDRFYLQLTEAVNAAANTVLGGRSQAEGVIANDDLTVGAGVNVTATVSVGDGDHLVIAQGGAIAPEFDTAVKWLGGDAIVDNSGRIASGDRALSANHVTGTLAFNNLATGVVEGDMRIGEGVTVTNSGKIRGNIEVDEPSATGRIVLNNLVGGVITGNGDIIRTDSNFTLNNAGRIVAGDLQTEGDAVDVASGDGDIINNLTSGYILGSRHAITGSRGITVVNDGTLIGRNGSGINMDNSIEKGDAIVTNRGLIEGRSAGLDDSDGDAIDADGLLRLENYGAVRGVGANGYHNSEPNVSEGIAAGGGTIVNYVGAEIYGYGRAIQIDDSGNGSALATTSIVNHGLIKGDGNGPEGVAPEDAAPFIERLKGGEAINIVGDFADSIRNTATGQIIGGVKMGGGNDTLDNDGKMTATNGSAVDLGEGDDLFVNRGMVTGDVLAGAGNDEIINVSTGRFLGNVVMGAGNDKFANSGLISGTIDMGEGDDVVNLYIGSNVSTAILLGAGDDRLTADMYMNTDLEVDAGTGDDTVTTSFGDDVIRAGAGNDFVYAEAGDDLVEGGDGNDTIHGNAGDDELHGDAGDDILVGGAGDDLLDGGAGIDTADYAFDTAGIVVDLAAGTADGDDIGSDLLASIEKVIGGSGNDTLIGDAGDNVFVGGLGNDVIDGGAGFDTLDLSDAAGPVSVDFAHGTVSGAGIGTDSFTGIEAFRFGAGDDVVSGGNGNETFDGGAGNDTLKGGAGDDTLAGGEGNDNLDGGSGDDVVNGGIGDDNIKAGSGNDTVDAGAGNDTVDAGSGDDVVLAGAGNDSVDAGSGDDRIVGGAGDDALTGGSGHDVFVFAVGFGKDIITDFKTTGTSSDVLEFSHEVFADATAALAEAHQVGSDVVFTIDTDTTLTLKNVQLASLNDFHFV